MTYGAAGFGAMQAMNAMNATKAMGSIVTVEAAEFLDILGKTEKPLVVHSPSGFVTKNKYITSYKGLVFFTKTKDELLIPAAAEIVNAKKISVPEM